MARIRTVKPGLFRHEALHEAEIATNLPLRLAFIGLFTCCDREGRFPWRPRALKLDVLPYDEIDFSRVLDELATRGFIAKYEANGEDFGVIPSFLRHQIINNRELASAIPPPPSDALPTRGERVSVSLGGNMEGKGNMEGNMESAVTAAFDDFFKEYPKKTAEKDALAAFVIACKISTPPIIIMGARRYAKSVEKSDPKYIKAPAKWLAGELWRDWTNGRAPIESAFKSAEELEGQRKLREAADGQAQ